MAKTSSPNTATLRSFGLLVGGIFLFIAIWPIIKSVLAFVVKKTAPRWLAWIPGLALVFFAIFFPDGLRKPYKAWMVIGEWLGWINTRLILGGIFFLLITPMGVIMRLFGYDPLLLEGDSDKETFKIPGTPRPGKHMKRQF